MKFSKDSWHYKLASYGNCKEAFSSKQINSKINLCPYVRKILFGVVKGLCSAILVFFGVAVTLIALVGIFSMLMFVFSGITGVYLHDFVQEDLGAICGIIFLVLTMFTFFASVGLWNDGDMDLFPKYITKYFQNGNKSLQQTKKPNLLVEWLKSKKDKVCPMIEFE